jgi:hypothetical protein
MHDTSEKKSVCSLPRCILPSVGLRRINIHLQFQRHMGPRSAWKSWIEKILHRNQTVYCFRFSYAAPWSNHRQKREGSYRNSATDVAPRFSCVFFLFSGFPLAVCSLQCLRHFSAAFRGSEMTDRRNAIPQPSHLRSLTRQTEPLQSIPIPHPSPLSETAVRCMDSVLQCTPPYP